MVSIIIENLETCSVLRFELFDENYDPSPSSKQWDEIDFSLQTQAPTWLGLAVQTGSGSTENTAS